MNQNNHNPLNRLAPGDKNLVYSWIECDQQHKLGQTDIIGHVRKQFNIEVTSEQLAEFQSSYHLEQVFDDSHFKPENLGTLLTALDSIDPDYLQEKAYRLMLAIAMKNKDLSSLLQIAKLHMKTRDLELQLARLNKSNKTPCDPNELSFLDRYLTSELKKPDAEDINSALNKPITAQLPPALRSPPPGSAGILPASRARKGFHESKKKIKKDETFDRLFNRHQWPGALSH